MDELKHTDLPEFVSEFFAQDLSEENKRNLIDWLHQDKKNPKVLAEYNDIWNASMLLKENEESDENIAWEKFKRKLVTTEPKKKSEWLKYAATALIFTITGSMLYYFLFSEKKLQKLTYQEIYVPYGSTSKIVLPDGSYVWLNAGSYLKYDNNFNIDNRNLFLKGEAFFEVQKNPKIGFVVNTPGLVVKAVGTKFNVKSYPEEKSIITTVVEGKVEVFHLPKNGEEERKIILAAKQSALAVKEYIGAPLNDTVVNKGSQKITKGSALIPVKIAEISNLSSTDKFVSWHEGRLIIERESLGLLAVELERRYNVKISFEDESIKNYVFSGVLKDETFEQVIEVIRLTSPILFTIDGNNVKLMEHKSLRNRLQ